MATTKKRTTKKASAKKDSTTTTDTTATTQAKKTAKKAAKKTTKRAAKKKTAKKTAKKKAVKKTTKKKTATKTKSTAKANATKAAAAAMRDIIARARDHFRKAPQEHIFYLVDGRTIQDLRELAESLEDMAEHVFSHHVNDDRHDFANWVHEVLQERALAEQLRESHKHPQSHQRVIYRHIVRRSW